jgi:gliding motility-associated-like protein
MPFQTTAYTLTASSADSCTASDSVTVHVLKKRDVFVPNAFSPNGDGINDLLTVFGGREVVSVRQFKVFSRWGALVFVQKDFQPNQVTAGWDGTFKGKELKPDVFAWFAEIEFVDGAVVVYEGDVAMVK